MVSIKCLMRDFGKGLFEMMSYVVPGLETLTFFLQNSNYKI